MSDFLSVLVRGRLGVRNGVEKKLSVEGLYTYDLGLGLFEAGAEPLGYAFIRIKIKVWSATKAKIGAEALILRLI